MKPFIGLLLVCSLAYGGIIPSTHVVSSQYHAQNELGEYSYGYAGGPSTKQETKTADGITRGGYSYVDGHGLVQSAAYVSDDVNGFRVAATNLPVGPAVPTGEVIEQAVAVAPAPVAIAPAAPVALAPAPAPISLAPAPVAIAQPEPVALAPAPVAFAPAPEAIAVAPEAIAPAPGLDAPLVPAPAPAPIAPASNDYYDDSTVIESADVALAKSAPAAPVYNPPVSVSETVAVSNARAAHLAAVEQTRARDALQASIDAAQLYATAPLVPAPVFEALPGVAPAVVRTAAVAPAVVRTAAVAHAPVVTAPVVAAAPTVVAAAPVAAVAPVAVGVTASQYHAQNELGEYSYGYAGGPSAKEEIKTADGITRGGYSYLDAHGLVQSAAYVSDPHNGFRVAATNLPVQPAPTYLADTPEVAHAKAKLFQAQAEHIAKL